MAARSRDALRFNILALQRRGLLYLWTFTFADVLSLRDAVCRWGALQRRLVDSLGFEGIRVFELHDTHGLHIHVLALGRYPIKLVRQLSQNFGFGRIHVQRNSRNPFYIAKYLFKQVRDTCLRGRRLWQCVGITEHTRCLDVHYDSTYAEIMRGLCKRGWRRGCLLRQAAKNYYLEVTGDTQARARARRVSLTLSIQEQLPLGVMP